MTNTIRHEIELKVVEAFLADVFRVGFTVNVHNGGDREELPEPTGDRELVLRAMFQTGEDRLNVYRQGRHLGHVLFIYGNEGWDVISDYSLSLQPLMASAERVADHYSR